MAEPGPCTTEVITRLSWRWSISNRRERAQHNPAVYLATGLGDPYRRARALAGLASVEAPRRDSDDRNETSAECGSPTVLADGNGRPSGQGSGSNFVLQMRASGESTYVA
jgi:hypothetical protein